MKSKTVKLESTLQNDSAHSTLNITPTPINDTSAPLDLAFLNESISMSDSEHPYFSTLFSPHSSKLGEGNEKSNLNYSGSLFSQCFVNDTPSSIGNIESILYDNPYDNFELNFIENFGVCEGDGTNE